VVPGDCPANRKWEKFNKKKNRKNTGSIDPENRSQTWNAKLGAHVVEGTYFVKPTGPEPTTRLPLAGWEPERKKRADQEPVFTESEKWPLGAKWEM